MRLSVSRRGRLALWGVVLFAALACSLPFKGQIVSYRVEAPSAAVAVPDDRVEALSSTVRARLEAAGFKGAFTTWRGDERMLQLLVPEALIPCRDEIVAVVRETVAAEAPDVRLEQVSVKEQK